MTRWLAFICSVAVLLAAHEAGHAVTAALYGEFKAVHFTLVGPEIQYRTPVDNRSGVHWALISGASNLATICLGYVLLGIGERIIRLPNQFLKAVLLYLTLIALLADPLNLSLGPFIYGGDANGIAAGLGIPRLWLQAGCLVILLVNRELVAQKLFPVYQVQVKHILLQPWIRCGRQSNRA